MQSLAAITINVCVRSWTFTMVTAVRYELVPSSQAQDKVTELSHLVQKVWIDSSIYVYVCH